MFFPTGKCGVDCATVYIGRRGAVYIKQRSSCYAIARRLHRVSGPAPAFRRNGSGVSGLPSLETRVAQLRARTPAGANSRPRGHY